MNKEIEILTANGAQTVRPDSLFIIAEVGNQFGGKLDTALELAKAAHEAGADAVKYIFWFPDEIMVDKSQMYTYETAEGKKTEPMFDLLDRLRLTLLEWQEVMSYCNKLGIIFMATINSPSGIEWGEQLSLPILKLSTWDWNFLDLWEWAARTHLPTIMDTGAVSLEEFDRNIDIFKRNQSKNIVIMHNVHNKVPDQTNLLSIPFMAERYDCLMGYCAPALSDDLEMVALGLGVCVIEKRLSLKRGGGILHDVVSKEPAEFKEYCTKMRNLKLQLGVKDWRVSDNDWLERKKWFRRIVADEFIPKGSTILRPMLEAKRGENGLSPFKIWDIVGKRSLRDIQRNETIGDKDVSSD